LFPKTNSFIDGHRQPLADIDEFCGKIKAGKDAQSDPNFCLIARVEAIVRAEQGLSGRRLADIDAEVIIEEGRLVHVRQGNFTGSDALNRVLLVEKGEFSVVFNKIPQD
jgi:hypothetical protein